MPKNWSTDWKTMDEGEKGFWLMRGTVGGSLLASPDEHYWPNADDLAESVMGCDDCPEMEHSPLAGSCVEHFVESQTFFDAKTSAWQAALRESRRLCRSALRLVRTSGPPVVTKHVLEDSGVPERDKKRERLRKAALARLNALN